MPIPSEHQHRSIYHFTHLDNLEAILDHGLLSVNEQHRTGLQHNSIANSDIQQRRASMDVPVGPGGTVHDYVPFYFCKRSSMLLSVVQSKNVDQQFLVYLAFPISIVQRPDVVFTNASANTQSPPQFFEHPSQLTNLNWTAIDNLRWRLGELENRQRMAEVLVHRNLFIEDLSFFVVWNELGNDYIRELYDKRNIPAPAIHYDTRHYFTNFPENESESLVSGPCFTRETFEDACKDFIESPKTGVQFADLPSVLRALDTNLDCLPATAELIGLQSDNAIHYEDVAGHTISVVQALRSLSEFQALSAEHQTLTALAAYLHDVGKGPKSRWAHNNGRQKVDPDHPIKGLPMVVEILTSNVANVDYGSARIILKLVAYHDLIGDILGRGRQKQQLFDIIEHADELNMLFALCHADVLALEQHHWWDQTRALMLKQEALARLSSR